MNPATDLSSVHLWSELYATSSQIPYSEYSEPNYNNFNGLWKPIVEKKGTISVSTSCNGGQLSSDKPTVISSQKSQEETFPENGLGNMEDSFKVVEETDLSLTSCIIHEPILKDFDNSSTFSCSSDCDVRLRHLGYDGLGKIADPIQERISDLKERMQRIITSLEDKVEEQRLALSMRRVSGEDISNTSPLVASPRTLKEEECEQKVFTVALGLALFIIISLQFSVSPGNGWTHVDVSDSKGVQWLPDHSVLNCMDCGAEFWMGRRRHHCR